VLKSAKLISSKTLSRRNLMKAAPFKFALVLVIAVTLFASSNAVAQLSLACALGNAEDNQPYGPGGMGSPEVATGGVPPYTFSIISGSLPTGLTLNSSTGEITGFLPTNDPTGTDNYTAQVVDSTNASATANCSITVYPGLAVACPASTDQVGVAYNSAVVGTGGMPPYTYGLFAPKTEPLPPGLMLNTSTGKITGTPTTAGTFLFAVYVVDGFGHGHINYNCEITVSTPTGNFTTYTQGGWGAPPHGGNPGALLKKYFSTVYPGGSVTIGGVSTGGYTLTFTGQPQIQTFLPQGGTPGVLTANATNPTSSSAGVFAGQVLALQLNIDFSAAGITAPGLGSLVVSGGPLNGYTYLQVLNLANAVLGGETSALPPGVTVSNLNDIVTLLNQSFD
jgi:hypothetical protein